VDKQEITVGYGLSHQHFDIEHDNIYEAIEVFFNLLARKKRITQYYKGNYPFKNIVEIEDANGNLNVLGTRFSLLFPYWKKTRKEVKSLNGLIEFEKIKEEIQGIKNHA
jgi:hypothetical protein